MDDYRWTRSGDGFGLGRDDARTVDSRLEGFVREHRIDIGSDRNHSKSLRLDEDGDEDELTILLNYQKDRDVNDMFRPGSFSTNMVRKECGALSSNRGLFIPLRLASRTTNLKVRG